MLELAITQDLSLNDATPKHLEPLVVVHDLELPRWMREWKVVVEPLHLLLSKELARETFKCLRHAQTQAIDIMISLARVRFDWIEYV